MPEFVKGLDLCQAFFEDIARPIIAAVCPNLRYSAAVIGYGSDVLGFDDAMSTDHMWGPRFQLFLPADGFSDDQSRLAEAFARGFPAQFKGYSVHFSAPDPDDRGVQVPAPVTEGRVNPLVEYHTLESFFEGYLGYTPGKDIPAAQWLTFSEHRLLGVTAGQVFHDDLGLNAVREPLRYFPRDVWLWMMAAQWIMLGEEEAFSGRTGYVGDEIGSRLIAARQVQRAMRLCFLMERRYAPYSKWFGSAFQQLNAAPQLAPVMERVLRAEGWQERGAALGEMYSLLAEKHNTLGVSQPLDARTRDYFERPFQVLFPGRFAETLLDAIEDPQVKRLRQVIGSVSQFTDSTTVFDDTQVCARMRNLYE